MEKKECLCEDGNAEHDTFFKRFLDSNLDKQERTRAVESIAYLEEYDKLTSRDLENILNYIVYADDVTKIVPDYGTIQWLACSCLRNGWGGEEDSEYIEGPACMKHLGCMISGEPNDFVEYVTDDSC